MHGQTGLIKRKDRHMAAAFFQDRFDVKILIGGSLAVVATTAILYAIFIWLPYDSGKTDKSVLQKEQAEILSTVCLGPKPP